jgi:hypothetical protein
MRGLGLDPTFLEGTVNDGDFDGFYVDGRFIGVHPQGAGILARSRAKPAGELGEIVRGMEALNGLFPAVPVNQVVPVRNDIAQGAALVAKGDPAIHAAGGLILQMGRLKRKDIFLPIFDALFHWTLVDIFPPMLHESGWFSHFGLFLI